MRTFEITIVDTTGREYHVEREALTKGQVRRMLQLNKGYKIVSIEEIL